MIIATLGPTAVNQEIQALLVVAMIYRQRFLKRSRNMDSFGEPNFIKLAIRCTFNTAVIMAQIVFFGMVETQQLLIANNGISK